MAVIQNLQRVTQSAMKIRGEASFTIQLITTGAQTLGRELSESEKVLINQLQTISVEACNIYDQINGESLVTKEG